MSDKATLGIAGAGGAVVLAIALAATSGSDESKLDPPPASCAYTLGESGSFVVVGDSGRCDLVFPPGRRMRCELAPVTDVTYQWSYRGTPLGIVTTGLKQGAVVGFTCKESK